jgi:putative transposase
VAKRCEQVIRQTADKYHAEIIALEIMPDPVHVLCEVDPQLGIHKLVKNLKGMSSHILRQEFHTLKSGLPTLWTNRYLVSTASGAPLAVIQQYGENQKNLYVSTVPQWPTARSLAGYPGGVQELV